EWDYLVLYQYWVPGYFRRVCETAWVDPIYERQEIWVYVAPVYATVTIELIPGHYRYYTDYWVETSRSLETHLDRRHGLGIGWQWDFPSLELRDGHIIYHSGQQSLTVDWNAASRFKDYPLLDIRFETDAQTFGNGQVASHYRVVTKDGRTSYFASDGRLLGIKDRYGNTITFKHTLWNGHHLIGEIVDSLGRETRLTYSQSAVELTAPDGRVWRYNLAPTSTGKPVLSSAVDPLGRITSYAYQLDTGYFSFTNKHSLTVANIFANLQSVIYPTGGSSSYTYIKARDNLGNDGARELYKISSRQDNIDATVANLVNYTYQGEPGGYPTTSSPFNLPPSYSYSGTMIKADGTTVKTAYNNLHLQTKLETDGPRFKQTIETTYNINKTPNQVQTTSFTGGASISTTTSTTFDNYNNLLSSTDALGNVTNYTYSSNWHQLSNVQTTRSDGTVVRTQYGINATTGNRDWERRYITESGLDRSIYTYYTYDSHGNMTRARLVMDGTERNTYYEYGAAYNHAYLTKVTTPYTDSLGNPVNEVTQYSYTLTNGRKATSTDPLGGTTRYQYDTIGRLTRETNPDNTYRIFTYDDQNLTVTLRLENNTEIQYAYDALGRLTEERVKENGVWRVARRVAYDNMSRKKKDINALNQETTYHYDSANRVIKVVSPDLTETVVTFDDAARLVHTTDASGNITTRKSDALGRLLEVRQKPDKSGGTTYFTYYAYDSLGNLISVTDAKGNITLRTYDALNRLRTVTYPSASRNIVSYTYNNAGQKLTETNGTVTNFSYDDRGLLTRISYSDGTYATFTYDLAGRRTGDLASASNISSSYTYNNRHRLTTLSRTIDGTAYAMTFGYDSVGNVTSILYPGDVTPVTQVYDDLNRLSAVNGFTGLSYDVAGRLTQMAYNNGITTNYTYNARGFLSNLTSSVLNLQYTYDAAGNITNINNESYTYDGLNRLLTANQPNHAYSVTYQYDKVGNRGSQVENGVSTTYTYNAVNELASSTGTTYTYDARGNLTGKVKGADTWLYTYDQANRLTEVKKNGQSLGTYFYDANGMRAKKVENGETTVYLTLGHPVMYEKTGAVATKHIFAGSQRIGEVKGGVVSYFHNDHLGSIRAVTSSTGTLMANMGTRPFGAPHASGAPTDYQFTGKELDDTSLYYFAARYYDPSVGRFVTEDAQKGHLSAPQSQNPYVYCYNNPLAFIDPDGNVVLSATTVTLTLVGGLVVASTVFILSPVGQQLVNDIAVQMGQTVTTIYTVAGAKAALMEHVDTAVNNYDPSKFEQRDNSVYVWVDPANSNKVMRVGRTNNFDRRRGEHRDMLDSTQYRMVPVMTGLAKAEAIGVEQTLISVYTLDALVNARREIARGNLTGFADETSRALGLAGYYISDNIWFGLTKE
ncbi:MAG: RHS repeat protein, partial [Peptococcaceae bacterium]|nr:RHS repeat protein [Peptococcaceae bacterium]